MKKILRYYQSDAVKATIESWKRKETPYCSVFTGLGKSLILADLTNRILNQGGRVIQLVPRLELVEQNYKEAYNYVDSKFDLGIVCSQLNKKQINKRAIIAQTSSFYSSRARSGLFNVCLIDENHLVAPDPNNQYRKILRSLLRINPNMLIAGFTGTPYRLDQGELHLPCIKNDTPVFTHKVYDTAIDVGLNRLIDEGYLAEIKICNTVASIDLSGVKKTSSGDFIADEVGKKFELIIDDAIEEIRKGFIEEGVETAIIFVSNLANAQHVLEKWGDPNTMRIVSGDTKKKHERAVNIEWLKYGTGCRYIVCVDLLTTGFDFNALDAVVLDRATVSPGLLVQMVGRIIRPYGDKVGKLWDFGSNFDRLGTLDNINVPKNKKKSGDAPTKLCLECETVNLAGAKKCKECGAEFIADPNAAGLYSMRSRAEILRSKWTTHEVCQVRYDSVLSKKSAPMLRIEYYDEFWEKIVSKFLLLESGGVAGTIAQQFLLQMFKDKRDFYALSNAGGLNCNDIALMLNSAYDEYFKRVVSVTVGEQAENSKYKELKSITYENN
jgi:DNA repair protein RadD